MVNIIRRGYNWCKRFRYRCGYGVHSPSDFFLITSVIYESNPYYAYETLSNIRLYNKKIHYRRKVYKLIFRLINYYQPSSIIDFSDDDNITLQYMHAAAPHTKIYSIKEDNSSDVIEQFRKKISLIDKIGLLHIGTTTNYELVVENALSHISHNSVIIVGGIYSSREKREWWKKLCNDSRCIITFDLYDVGIIMFPQKRYKQNYIVNFL